MTAPARRRAAASIALTAALVGAALAVPLPASAATLEANSGTSLEAAIVAANAEAGADTIEITADITRVDLLLDVTDTLTIDTNGFTVSSVRLRATADLSMVGGGTWVAGMDQFELLGVSAPGIGIAAGFDLTITDMTVTAYGTICDAAIGGWQPISTFDDGCGAQEVGPETTNGSITIIDSNVTATGGPFGAGIGSGSLASDNGLEPGTISILDSIVVAVGGPTAAGIGGGSFAPGGPVVISGGEVSASGDQSGIGGAETLEQGTLVISDATVTSTRITSSTTVPAGTVLTADGLAVSGPLLNEGTIVARGVISGIGTITNRGVIRFESLVTASSILVNNYTISYDDNHADAAAPEARRHLAPTLDSVDEALPVPFRDGLVISEWNTQTDGSGETLDTDSGLAALADGAAGFVVYAIWEEPVVDVVGQSVAVAGGTVPVSVTTSGPFGSRVALAGAVVTSSEPTDVVTGYDVVTTRAGMRTITVVVDGETTQFDVHVVPDVVAELELDAPALTVAQGDSLTFAVSGTDQFGNPVVLDPTEVVLSSSVATDVIDGLTVRFPTASPHVITATVGEVSTSVTVTVTPAAVAPAPQPAPSAAPTPVPSPNLAATGAAQTQTGWLLGLTLLVIGTALLALRRRGMRA